MKANKTCGLRVTALGLAFMMSLTGCSNSKSDDNNKIIDDNKVQIEHVIDVPEEKAATPDMSAMAGMGGMGGMM